MAWWCNGFFFSWLTLLERCRVHHWSPVAVPSLLLVLQSGIHCLTVCAISCWARAVLMEPDNPPVCLLLAFRWQYVRGVFMYPHYTNLHLLTYLLTYSSSAFFHADERPIFSGFRSASGMTRSYYWLFPVRRRLLDCWCDLSGKLQTMWPKRSNF